MSRQDVRVFIPGELGEARKVGPRGFRMLISQELLPGGGEGVITFLAARPAPSWEVLGASEGPPI